VKVFYSISYCDTSVAWDTTRKSEHVAHSLIANPIDGVELIEPEIVSLSSLADVLDSEYIDALVTGCPRALAESNDIGWDEKLLSAVRSSSGGVVAATMTALTDGLNSGSLSSGLHHARPGSGSGFCTINGLALGARAAFSSGAGRVLSLDLDAHAGGGTAAYIKQGIGGLFEQLDVSVISYDTYSGITGAELVMSGADTYLDDIEKALSRVASPESIDVILYNAGMDPHESAGGVFGVTTEMLARREELVFSWAASHGVPVAWVLAGGYSTNMEMDELTGLHRLTLAAAVGK
jgi:acetoin utilization deacetylase AcuC-like enzyme